MANPKIKFKRSAVANKRPSLSNLELGELALNTYDGKLFTRQDTSGVGIATTVTLINPWNEAYGEDKISYGGTVTTGDINVEDLTGQNIFITGVTTSIGGFILRNPNENNYSLNTTPPDYSDNSGGPTMDENPISAGIYADGSASFSGIVTATNGFVGNLTGNVTGTADNANTVGGVTSSFLLDYNNFTNTPTIPTNNNELTNGAGYITSSSDITGNAATATYAVNAGFSTNAGYAHTAGISTTSDFATNSSYAHVAGIATYATTAGVATNAQGLTGTPSITVSNITASQLDVSGITTASSFSGDGSTLSGIVTQIAAGDNISIDQGTGVVTITGLANTAHVRAETLTVSGVSTFSDDANFQNVSVGGTLSLSGAGSQFFAFNEDTVKVKFANWYSSNDRQYGMGQLWFETWFAAIDNNPSPSLRDERRIGFYLEQPNNGSSDSGGTSNIHPTNDRMHIDINGVFVRDNFEVSGDANVTGISTFQSDVNVGGDLTITGNTSIGILSATDAVYTGVVTATSFSGSGTNLTGLVTSIVAGDNISVSGSTGEVTITGLANTSNVQADTLTVSGVSTFTGQLNAGTISASNGTFSGNVTIGGTLTYEDVKNIDSVGIVTARSGVRITGGGVDVVGVSTFNNDIYVDQIRRLTDNSTNTKIQLNAGQMKLFAGNGTTAKISLNGTVAITTNTTVTGVLTATSFSGNGTNLTGLVTSIIAGDNISVSGSTGSVTITGLANTSNVVADSLVVSGISTLGIVTGVTSIEATTYYGDGSNLTGIANTANVSANTLVVSGVSTLGVVTGATYYGDGSNLTGIANTANVSADTVVSGIITASSQFYPPTLTTSERNAITVTQGALIFNTTENKVQMYLGSEWKSLAFELDTYTSIGI